MDAIPETVASKTALEVVREALRNEYDVREEIGRGGMAMVFRGEERGLKREVAIKVLPFTHIHDANLVERFENEARTSASLEHPNIIPIYRVGRAGDVIFFAMRYLGGPSLANMIDEVGPLDPRDIRRILIEASRALGYAHRKNIVHRDIKPDNIMFNDDGEVVVCDFGIAKAIAGTQLTATGKAIGTPYYMSPEQIRAQELDGRSDIYSLGVVAYQCFTKKVPFDGEDSFAIGYKHVTQDVPVPTFRTPEHRNLYAIILRMMAKDPADRYQSAEELIEALTEGDARRAMTSSQEVTRMERALRTPRPSRAISDPRQTPPPVPTPSTPVPTGTTNWGRRSEITARQKRRSPMLAAAFLVILLGSVGGGGYYYVEVAHGTVPDALRPLTDWLGIGIAPLPIPDSTAADSTLLATNDSTGVDSLAADSTVSDSTGADSTVADSTPPPVDPTPNTGTLVIAGASDDASVFIDDRFVNGFQHDVRPGAHDLRIVSPGSQPYMATISVARGDTVVHQVQLVQAAQCERFDEPGYNAQAACFDVPPQLGQGTTTLVPLPAGLAVRPSRPAILAVQVDPNGRAGLVIVSSPSDIPQFTIAAVQFAKELVYVPAVKNGTAVTAWLETEFYPGQ